MECKLYILKQNFYFIILVLMVFEDKDKIKMKGLFRM